MRHSPTHEEIHDKTVATPRRGQRRGNPQLTPPPVVVRSARVDAPRQWRANPIAAPGLSRPLPRPRSGRRRPAADATTWPRPLGEGGAPPGPGDPDHRAPVRHALVHASTDPPEPCRHRPTGRDRREADAGPGGAGHAQPAGRLAVAAAALSCLALAAAAQGARAGTPRRMPPWPCGPGSTRRRGRPSVARSRPGRAVRSPTRGSAIGEARADRGGRRGRSAKAEADARAAALPPPRPRRRST